jgi:quercetin dioxygenase-like cupin family protein
MMSTMIHGPGEGIRTCDLGGTTVTTKADGATTGDAFVVAETTLAPGGFEPPLHLHREMAESFYVLSGRVEATVGSDRTIVGAGTFVSVPPGVAHTMSVVGADPVRMLLILSNPERATQMLDTLERVFADGDPDPQTAGPLLAQIDMEILAPAAS